MIPKPELDFDCQWQNLLIMKETIWQLLLEPWIWYMSSLSCWYNNLKCQVHHLVFSQCPLGRFSFDHFIKYTDHFDQPILQIILTCIWISFCIGSTTFQPCSNSDTVVLKWSTRCRQKAYRIIYTSSWPIWSSNNGTIYSIDRHFTLVFEVLEPPAVRSSNMRKSGRELALADTNSKLKRQYSNHIQPTTHEIKRMLSFFITINNIRQPCNQWEMNNSDFQSYNAIPKESYSKQLMCFLPACT